MTLDRCLPEHWKPEACTLVRSNGEIIRFYVSRIDLDLTKGVTFNSGYLRLRWRGGYMHDLIALRLFDTIPDGYNVDHVDNNRCNNVRSNLRLATWRGQHLNRTHAPKGYQRRKGRWRAYGQAPEGRQYLGNFATEAEAKHCADSFRVQMILMAHCDGSYIYPVWPD
jgi:HNH endonuclease